MHGRTNGGRSLEREHEALRRAVSLLHRVSTLVRESPEIEPTYYAILTGVTAGVGLGLNRAMLFLRDDDDRNRLRGVAAVGPRDAAEADRVWRSIEAHAPDLKALHESGLRERSSPGALDEQVKRTLVPVRGKSPVAHAMRTGAVVRGAGEDDLGGLLHLPTAVVAPLRGQKTSAGVLYADNRFTGRPVDPTVELLFSLIAEHAGRAIESAFQYDRVARQARTDALTGLGHHGAMMAAVGAAMARARAEGTALGLAMVDLDDFKQVNDRLGHLAGDALLAGVAARLRAAVRKDETPFRYGGEEFAVLLPGVPARELPRVGERLRKEIATRPFPLGAGPARTVTCSIGVAAANPGHRAPEDLIADADGALLRAKRNGKNRVELAEPPPARALRR